MGTEAQLAAIIGEELAEEIIERTKRKSRELIEAGVAYKGPRPTISKGSTDAVTAAVAAVVAAPLETLTATVEDLKSRMDEVEKPIAEKIKAEMALLPNSIRGRAPMRENPVTRKSRTVNAPETPEAAAARRAEFWAKANPEDLGE